MAKKVSRQRKTRREIEPFPIYGHPLAFFHTEKNTSPYDPLHKKVEFAGWDVPKTMDVNGKKYYRYKDALLRSSVAKLVKTLRAKGYYARVFEVKRRAFGRAIVVNHWIYTRPKYGTL